jgi:hypothetical protein
MHPWRMLSRVKTYFKGSRLVRMSSGSYCLVRDLGLVKGGKGLRHHETLMTFSLKGVRLKIRWHRSRQFHDRGNATSQRGVV